jgi:hypothetical protein
VLIIILMNRALRIAFVFAPVVSFRKQSLRVFRTPSFLLPRCRYSTPSAPMSEFSELENALGRVTLKEQTNHSEDNNQAGHNRGTDQDFSRADIATEKDDQVLSRSRLPYKSTQTNMAVYFHPMCSQHRIPDHPEHYSRVDSILAVLRSTWKDVLHFRESLSVTEDQIMLFHTPGLLKRFRKLADACLQDYQQNKHVSYKPIDMDTTVMWQTRPAAFYAAGAVVCAVDSMYAPPDDASRIDTAFCCVRPPGHHAERDKAGGFCFFNSVAIGARYAQKSYGVERVAVLDFDVHHGNGKDCSLLRMPYEGVTCCCGR